MELLHACLLSLSSALGPNLILKMCEGWVSVRRRASPAAARALPDFPPSSFVILARNDIATGLPVANARLRKIWSAEQGTHNDSWHVDMAGYQAALYSFMKEAAFV